MLEVVGRGVAGDAARVLADLDDVAAIEGLPGEGLAVLLVEGGALDVGPGEGRARRGQAVDQGLGALAPRRPGELGDLAAAELALDLRRLGVALAVLPEGFAEPRRELGAGEVAVDVG